MAPPTMKPATGPYNKRSKNQTHPSNIKFQKPLEENNAYISNQAGRLRSARYRHPAGVGIDHLRRGRIAGGHHRAERQDDQARASGFGSNRAKLWDICPWG